MRVLLANKFFYVRGGAERSLFDTEAALRERGHEVIHFAMQHPRNRASTWERHFVSRVRFRDAPALETARSTLRLFYSREVRSKLRALIAEARPDVALLNNVYHQLGPSLLLELAAQTIPALMILHDFKVVCPSYLRLRDGAECSACSGGRFRNAARFGCGGSRLRGAVLAAESSWQWRLLGTYGKVAKYLTPSDYAVRVFRDMGFPYPVTRLRHGVRLPDRIADVTKASAMGFVGRLSHEKGVDALLDAAAELPDIPLRIVGEGPLGDHLRQRVDRERLNHVLLTGYLRRDALFREMGTWRAAILPSLAPENSPYATLEAMSLGLPVIASRTGGIEEVVGDRGLLVSAGDARELRDAMAALWNDPGLAVELGGRGRDFVSSHCSWAGFGDALEGHLLDLVADARPLERHEANVGS